jgi:predicted RNase H-like HicB family nuclease
VGDVELTIRVHREDDAYWAEVTELPGCFASGESLDGLLEALEEAVTLYLEDDSGEGSNGASRTPRILRIDELKALV